MKIVVGLGNPGVKYESTPHSIGFEAVDYIAARYGAEWVHKRAAQCYAAEVTIASEKVTLVKPQTFMNLSGESVAALFRYSNSSVGDLIVIQDDIDMSLGRLRVRVGGSAGGHNGIKNIIERIGTQDFIRVKIGVGKDASNVIGHVLGKFPPRAREIATKIVEVASNAVECLITQGAQKAMNEFNGVSIS